ERRLPTVRPMVRRLGGSAVTCVLSLLASFEPSGSAVADEATGRAVIVPCWPRPVRTAMSIAALSPAPREAASHVTVTPSLVHANAEPATRAAPTSVVPEGIGMARRGRDALEGPALCRCAW